MEQKNYAQVCICWTFTDLTFTYIQFDALSYPCINLTIGDESDTELAETIFKASGPIGSNYQYVLNMAECLRNINVSMKKAKSVFAIEKKIKSLLKGNEQTKWSFLEKWHK